MEPVLTPASAIPAKPDFPDWLSPMLVKELRQGVRTRVFVSQFILLQLAMLLTISLTLLISAGGQDTSEGGVFFWVVVGGTILFALPLSGLNSVGGEIKANTLELIFLTRQTAFRIVAGKWLAIFVQALLFVCAVLPYLVLRYFVGGINLSVELITLGSMLVGSALLTAFATGISAYPARIGRSLAFFGCLFVLFSLQGLPFLFGGSRFGGSGGGGPGIGVPTVLALLACAGILLVLLLEAGAAKIAPPAENHSAIMRLLALAGLLLAAVCHFTLREPEPITVWALLIATLVCAGALCEQPRSLLSIYRPFAARGGWGRLVGRLLYPGWHTGVWFTLLVFGCFAWILERERMLVRPAQITRYIALIGTLVLPAAVIRAFFSRSKRGIAIFFGVVVFSLAATALSAILDSNLKTSLREVCAALPISALIFSLGDSDADTAGRLALVAFTTAVSLLVLIVASFRPLRETRLREDESVAGPRPPLPAPETVPAATPS